MAPYSKNINPIMRLRKMKLVLLLLPSSCSLGLKVNRRAGTPNCERTKKSWDCYNPSEDYRYHVEGVYAAVVSAKACEDICADSEGHAENDNRPCRSFQLESAASKTTQSCKLLIEPIKTIEAVGGCRKNPADAGTAVIYDLAVDGVCPAGAP
ncbi:unnamed protein product [Amoebophrya sp. A25]|nr:unnamed protein product [Amoebophrya sp. A25]|eukprot:GSA25T00016993001.1